MLISLRIKDYILIDELEVSFSEGFNVLTGETGAGKSILLGALRLVLGDRLQGDVIRQGAPKAVIQAQFSVETAQLEALLDDEVAGEDTLILTREILASGKSTCKLNGSLCTLAELKSVGERLLTIHGQHDHQQLNHSDRQLALLDQLLDSAGKQALWAVQEAYGRYARLHKALSHIQQDPSAIERQLDLVAFQMEDIDQAQLGEDDEGIETRLEAMKHAEGIIQDLEYCRNLIESEDEGASVLRMLNELIRRMERYERYLPEYRSKREWLTDALYQLKELADDQGRSAQQLLFDPYELMTLEKRVDVINHLKRKYGNSLEEIASFRLDLDKQQTELLAQQGSKEKLQGEIDVALMDYEHWAKVLGEHRRALAVKFEKALCSELKQLNFKEASVTVALEDRGAISSNGNEHMELLVSLNKGMPLAPLKRVASGGEISRVMLAIKAIAADNAQSDTLIFDEIDSGISGHTASVVGEKLFQVSRGRQVICITHLAQVALMADQHFLIEKSERDDATVSNVIALDNQGSAGEIARIMGGNTSVEGVVAHAAALLEEAQQKKLKLLNT